MWDLFDILWTNSFYYTMQVHKHIGLTVHFVFVKPRNVWRNRTPYIIQINLGKLPVCFIVLFNLNSSDLDYSIFLGGSYVCEYCYKVLSNKYNLKIHIRDVHEESNQEELICPYCYKKSKSKSSLRIHIATNHRSLPSQ